MQAWKLLSSKLLVESPYLRVYENSYELPNKERIPRYYITDRNDSALCVCCIDTQVLLIRQYRPGIKQASLCHPGGRIETTDASAVSGALRELLEETGYEPYKVTPLGTYAQIPAVSGARVHILLVQCHRAAQGNPRPDRTEDLHLEFVELSRLEEVITSGQMDCIACVAASYRALAYLANERA